MKIPNLKTPFNGCSCVLLTFSICLRLLNESYVVLLLEILLKLKFIYSYMYYEILIYWVVLAHFSLTLPLFRQCFSISALFLFSFLILWRQVKGILQNMYDFNLINFTKLWSLFATFFNTQQHFNVVSMLLLGWYNVETLDNVKSTLKQRCVCQRWNLKRWTMSN